MSSPARRHYHPLVGSGGLGYIEHSPADPGFSRAHPRDGRHFHGGQGWLGASVDEPPVPRGLGLRPTDVDAPGRRRPS